MERHRMLAFALALVATSGVALPLACVESGNVPSSSAAGAQLVCAEPASNAARDLACSRWACAHAEMAPATWDGSSKTCSAGTIDPRARDRSLRLINAYRFLAGVPDLVPDPSWEPPAQDCALLADANHRLSHTPTHDWSCWTDRGARASAVSLVANRSAPLAIDPFIEDPGNESSMVHRRWLLSEKIHRIGLGSTTSFACAVVDGREWDPDHPSAANEPTSVGANDGGAIVTKSASAPPPAWVAWPPSGPVPIDVFRRTNVDTLGWTIQSSTLDLDGAKVTVESSGQRRPVKVSPLERTLGSLTAIRFVPDGWSSEEGKRYDVHVEKEGVQIDFAVTPVSCD